MRNALRGAAAGKTLQRSILALLMCTLKLHCQSLLGLDACKQLAAWLHMLIQADCMTVCTALSHAVPAAEEQMKELRAKFTHHPQHGKPSKRRPAHSKRHAAPC